MSVRICNQYSLRKKFDQESIKDLDKRKGILIPFTDTRKIPPTVSASSTLQERNVVALKTITEELDSAGVYVDPSVIQHALSQEHQIPSFTFDPHATFSCIKASTVRPSLSICEEDEVDNTLDSPLPPPRKKMPKNPLNVLQTYADYQPKFDVEAAVDFGFHPSDAGEAEDGNYVPFIH